MSRRRSSERDNRGQSQRQLRVGEELRHQLALLLERGEWRAPGRRGAPIPGTAVDASPDLRTATAFVMPRGGQDEQRVLAAMRRAAPWFRARVGERARLRYAPELRFEIDRSFDEADRIGALLRRPDVARDLKDE